MPSITRFVMRGSRNFPCPEGAATWRKCDGAASCIIRTTKERVTALQMVSGRQLSKSPPFATCLSFAPQRRQAGTRHALAEKLQTGLRGGRSAHTRRTRTIDLPCLAASVASAATAPALDLPSPACRSPARAVTSQAGEEKVGRCRSTRGRARIDAASARLARKKKERRRT